MAIFGALSFLRLFRPKQSARGVLEGQSWVASVEVVIDGDTLWVKRPEGRIRVRLAHIDAPEVGQPWSDEATQWLRTVLPAGTAVALAPVEVEAYGRVLANVYTRNWAGRRDAWINFWLVRNGLAWAVPGCRDRDCSEAQIAAQQERQGLWCESYPTPPWVFRKSSAALHLPADEHPAVHSRN